MDTSALSPATVNFIQSTFVNQLGGAFANVSHYAISLFYIIAGIEIALFGLAWALKQEEALANFLFKVIKLGLVFFIITLYPHLLEALVTGFTKVAISAAGGPEIVKYLTHPSKLLQFSFDNSLSLLVLAVQYGTLNMGMSLIYLVLGFGLLFMFALIMADIVLVLVAFYVLALLALLLIPFGAMTPTRNLFEKAISSLLSAGARIFALIIVLGAAVSVWGQYNLSGVSQSTTLIQPLGFFFVTLVFLVLIIKLPPMAAKAVGNIGGSYFANFMGASSPSVSVNVSAPTGHFASNISTANGQAGLSSTAAAASMSAAVGLAGSSAMQTATTAPLSAAGSVNVNASAKVVGNDPKAGKLRAGADIQQGISRETLNKLKATFKQVLDEKDKG